MAPGSGFEDHCSSGTSGFPPPTQATSTGPSGSPSYQQQSQEEPQGISTVIAVLYQNVIGSTNTKDMGGQWRGWRVPQDT